MSTPNPTAGRPARIVSIADVERFRRWTRDGEPVDPDEDLGDIDGLLAEIRQAEPSTDGVKPERIKRR
jgi:hypothetical protein